ncbi:MAG TPA: carboxypeptidase regulatory-like domain-containing protein [bacterium]|jgi:hypothetical protein
MKARISILLVMLLLGAGLFGPKLMAAEFSPTLEYELSKAHNTDFVSAIVILESPIDIRALDERLHVEKASKLKRHTDVLAALHYNAESTQPKIRAEFDQAISDGVMQGYTPYWIENAFIVYATRDFIEGLRTRGDIKYVTENFRPVLIDPIRPAPNAKQDDSQRHGRNPLDTRTLAVGIQEVGALRVNEELGITGNGVLIGDCDTGTDGTHPALASRWRGNFAPWWQCWKDNINHNTTFPTDNGSHGTHTMGTMTGRGVVGTDTTWVGCAPNARWISNNAINMSVGRTLDNEIFASFQWFTDPDTVAHSLAAVPDVINNSWGVYANIGGDPVYTQCFDYWNTVILNAEAAGIVVIFAAGNEASSGLRSPAIYSMNATQIFSVAAVDGTTNPVAPYPLASFSSTGPTPCTPANPNNIKPEIAGPGVNVLSSVPGGTYQNTWSGTSMATPHISGIVALMREACPNCDPQTIKQALLNTAIRTGYVTPPATENNQFGNGFVDGYAAVVSVSNLGHVVGLVRDASNNPIVGATVSNANGVQSVQTDATGHYDLPLSAGTYTLHFAKFAYVAQNIPGVVVVTGQNTTQNATLQLAPAGIVQGTVTSCNGGPAVGATVTILNTPITPATTDAAGHYSISAVPQGTYDMSAAGAGCGPQTVNGVVIGANTTQNFTLTVDPMYMCSTPDADNYIACENGDQNGPTYNWVEISPNAAGPGTLVTGLSDDNFVGPFTLPFTFRFYDRNFTQFYIGSNGYLTFDFGYGGIGPFTLPSAFLGHSIQMFSRDLYPPIGGDVSTYYLAAQNAFIIEYHQIQHYSSGSPETFQVWLYNFATNPAPNGNSQLLLQYNTVSDASNCGVGIQDSTRAYVHKYNTTYDPHAQPLVSGRAICFGGCTPPVTGTMAGTITNCTGGPAANATVSFPGSFYPSITADANGHYSINMVAGTYNVRGDKVGCTFAEQDNNVVNNNQTTTVNLTLRAPTGLQGTVTNCTGGPAVGAIVTFPTSTLAPCTTDASGHYLRYSDAGTFTVHAASSSCSDVDSPNHVVALLQMVTVNVTLNAAGTLSGTVTSCNGGPAVGAVLTLIGTGRPTATTNASGFYSFTGLPAATYNVATAFTGCWPDTGLGIVVTSGNTTTRNITLISNPALQCSPADAYGYVACENVDPNGPVYNWRGISPSEGGPGTQVTGLADDNFVGPFTAPFTMRVYGVDYTQYFVGSNGYMTFGTGYGSIPGGTIPVPGYPAGYYPFGADMYPPGGGQVATYYDAAQHVFILEYYQTNHCCNSTTPETFEIIVYDPLYYPTATGDCDVVFQYNALTQPTFPSQVGVQNSTGTVGNNYQHLSTLPTTSMGIATGRAVRFSTGVGCQGSPTAVITPSSITKSVPLNGTATDSVHICNTGICPLNWTMAYHQITPALTLLDVQPNASPNMSKDMAEGRFTMAVKADKTHVSEGARGRNQLDAQGGPDVFGYRWIDSAEPGGPTFNWVEINATGINTGLHADDAGTALTLPWQFNFYGTAYSSVWVCTNGFLQMGTTGVTPWGNTTIPSASAPLTMLAPFWEDLNSSTSGNIWYYNDVANNRFIVEWDAVPHYDGTGNVTFEAILYPDGHWVVQFMSMNGTNNGCTVGQQNATGTDGLQVVYNAAYVQNNLAVRFAAVPPVPQWLSITPPTAGQVMPNTCAWVHLNFNSAGLTAGQYLGTLTVASNDVAHNPVTIPLTFIVGVLNPPTQLTLAYDPALNQLILRWAGTGAPSYRVYSRSVWGGATTLVGSTANGTLSIPFNTANAKLFYEVTSWDGTLAESAPSQPVRLGAR